MTRPRPFAFHRDGRDLAGLEWGGGDDHLVLLHPNGFCAGLFDPLARRLALDHHVVAIDLAGHGRSAPLAGDDLTFPRLATDVIAVLDALDIESAVAVGQSLGGGIAILVDQARPGLFRRLLLCEPVAFPIIGTGPNPMSERARARRLTWADRDEFVRTVGSKPPLAELAPDALHAYARWGLLDRADGGVQLACLPDTEAAVFEVSGTANGAPAAWAHLPSLHAPAVIIAGDRSFLPLTMFEQQATHAGLPLEVVPGGHFLLQEDSGQAANLLRRHGGFETP
ncbi:MAG TPA: alpha/beta hydrolase [Acidimicrobiales bacterium]|nr:alpha/beta hydrolase [Acidimicrobiales bacterium]